VFLICLAANLALRSASFFRSVLDWDESLYTLMARQWLAGHLPYTTIWDNKPVGIYAIFAAFEAVFQNPVIAIRAATVTCVSLLGVIVWRLTHLVLAAAPEAAARRLAWLAALTFTLGALSNDGLSANTELFMECCSAAAVLAAIDPAFCAGRPGLRAACAGGLFGLACMIKYVAVFEAPALAFAVLAAAPAERWSWRGAAQKSAAAVAGALFLPGLTVLTYAAAGRLTLWWDCSIAANFTRVAAPVARSQLHAVAFIILPRWAPAIAAACIVLAAAPGAALAWSRGRAAARFDVLLALWLAGGALGVCSAKSFYDHYFLQILPAISIALAMVIARLVPGLGSWRAASAALLSAALLIIPAYAGFSSLAAIIRPLRAPGGGFKPDTPSQIAALLRPQVAGGATLYVFDSQPIIYALTGATPPTRFVLPSVLTRCFLARVAGVNAPAEVARILSTNPDFIVTATGKPQTPDPVVYAAFTGDLAARYALWQGFPDAEIYRLRPGAPTALVAPRAADCG
jgi:hypothetical protein